MKYYLKSLKFHPFIIFSSKHSQFLICFIRFSLALWFRKHGCCIRDSPDPQHLWGSKDCNPHLMCKGLWRSNCLFGLKSYLQRHEKEETQTFTRLKITALIQSASRQVTIRSGSHLSTKEAQRVDDLPKVTQLWVDCHACLTPCAVLSSMRWSQIMCWEEINSCTRKMLLSHKGMNGFPWSSCYFPPAQPPPTLQAYHLPSHPALWRAEDLNIKNRWAFGFF